MPPATSMNFSGANNRRDQNHKDKPTTIVRSFDDNRMLPALFGQHDEFLTLIETELDITITPRGNKVSIRGNAVVCKRAERVFDELVNRINNNLDIDVGDVKGAIRMSDTASDAPFENRSIRLKTPRKMISPRSVGQQQYLEAIIDNELVFGAGPAGTGKSYLAVACAVAALNEGLVERIIFSRPAVEAGENLGFLPGDMKEKVDPYLRPLYDALYDVMATEKVEKAIEDGVIEIAPLAFMRGRTLANAFIILDEAQNTTVQQMKMFLTRLGEGSVMVINGDTSQIDLPRGTESGLAHALGLLEGVKGIAQVRLTYKDIVRHQLVTRIVQAYEAETKQ